MSRKNILCNFLFLNKIWQDLATHISDNASHWPIEFLCTLHFSSFTILILFPPPEHVWILLFCKICFPHASYICNGRVIFLSTYLISFVLQIRSRKKKYNFNMSLYSTKLLILTKSILLLCCLKWVGFLNKSKIYF